MFYITGLFLGFYGLFLFYIQILYNTYLVEYIQYDIIVFTVCLYVICGMARG